MITLRGVSKSYGALTALHPTDLTVAAGQTTVLLGPSGCGKSTLLRLMLGLVRPDEGTITIGGTTVTDATVEAMRRRIGYVIQEGGLFPHLSARDNVALMARYLGWSSDDTRQRVDELADLVRLPPERLDDFPVQLSGGQRQRVGLMRALLLDPDVLLLDEPLGALDPMIRAELQEDLRAIFRQLGKTVVLVTHDLGEAAHFADTVVLMRAGYIVQQGSLADLVRAPAEPFVDAFIRAQRPPALDA